MINISNYLSAINSNYYYDNDNNISGIIDSAYIIKKAPELNDSFCEALIDKKKYKIDEKINIFNDNLNSFILSLISIQILLMKI
jgi:hypothetical protein